MNKTIFKELERSIFNKKFQNIGYLPRWIIFAIDVFIVSVACIITTVIINTLSVVYKSSLDVISLNLIIVLVNAVFFMVYRTYSGIIRHSTFIDGIKLLVATTSSYFILLFFNIGYYFLTNKKLFLSTGLFITFVISFLLLFLFRILVKNIFEILVC